MDVVGGDDLVEERVEDEHDHAQQEEGDRANDFIQYAWGHRSMRGDFVPRQRGRDHQRHRYVDRELDGPSPGVLVFDDLLLDVELEQHEAVDQESSQVQHRYGAERVEEDFQHVVPEVGVELPLVLFP